MPEDLKLSQISSSPLPPPFKGLHSPGVRKHCEINFACNFRESSIRYICGLSAPFRLSSSHLPVPKSLYGLCGRKATLMKGNRAEPRSCVKVEMAGLGSPLLIALTVSVDVEQH